MIQVLAKILYIVQPFTVIIFVIGGVCHILMKNYQLGAMQLILAGFNWLCYYGMFLNKGV